MHRGGPLVPLIAVLMPLALLAAVLACTPQTVAPPASTSMQLPSVGASTDRLTASLEDAPTGVRVSIEGTGFTPGTYQVTLVAGTCTGAREVRVRLFPLFAGDAGMVKGQALAQGLRLHDLVASHSLVITGEGAGQPVSCAVIPPSD